MSIHTFSLIRNGLKRREYGKICNQVYKLVENGQGKINYRDHRTVKFQIEQYPGISIQLSDYIVPQITLTVNPAHTQGRTYAELSTFSSETMQELADTINALLKIIGLDYTFDKFFLMRIDCTQDIVMPTADSIVDLIGCVKRSKLHRRYELDTFNCTYPNYKEKNRHSFRTKCQDITLTIYDKTFQLNDQHLMQPEDIPPNLLRVETAFGNTSFQRILNEHASATYINQNLSKKIITFSDLSVQLLRKYLKHVVMPGRYLRYDAAIEEIDRSSYPSSTKERMKSFLRKVSRYYKNGVDGAILDCKLSEYAADYMLKLFNDLNWNPVTLPISSKYRELPDIIHLLDGALPA